MNRGRDEIAELVDRDSVIISHHARVRMFERNISTDALLSVIRRRLPGPGCRPA